MFTYIQNNVVRLQADLDIWVKDKCFPQKSVLLMITIIPKQYCNHIVEGFPLSVTLAAIAALIWLGDLDCVVPLWGFVCRGGRVTKRVFNGRVSQWKGTCIFSVLLAWILEMKVPLDVGCNGQTARRKRWNETRTYWLGFGVGLVAAWPF